MKNSQNINLIALLCLMTFSLPALEKNNTVTNKSPQRKIKVIPSNELVSKTDEVIMQYTDAEWFSGSVVIFKDDKIIYDKGFGFADINNKVRNT